MDLITPKVKDIILNELVSNLEVNNCQPINTYDLSQKLGISEKTISGILHQFDRFGLISIVNYNFSGNWDIYLNVEAHDMVRKGGFVGEEEVFKDNLEKLALEIKKLGPNHLVQAEKMSNILNAIINFLKLPGIMSLIN